MAGRLSGATHLSGGAQSLADAGMAAVATFAAGLIALRSLTDHELALYALIFAAATALMVAPQYMNYLPQRMHVNRQPQVRRTDYGRDVRGALPYAGLTSLGVVLAGLPLLGTVGSTAAFVALTATAAVVTMVSPFQDHQRASLHFAGLHGRAAAMSAVNLVIVGSALVGVELGEPPDWLRLSAPFGALALGNIASIVAGYFLHRRVTVSETRDDVPLGTAALVSSHAFARQGSAYVMNLLVAALISPVALATLETARVAAQPVFILGTGIASYFTPQVVRAIGAGDDARASRIMRRLMATVATGGALYSLLLLPFASLLAIVLGRPVDAPLASARAASFTVSAAANPFNSYNLAEKRYALALGLTVASELPGLVVLVIALPLMGIYAVPVAATVAALLRIALNVVARRRRRRAGAEPPTPARENEGSLT